MKRKVQRRKKVQKHKIQIKTEKVSERQKENKISMKTLKTILYRLQNKPQQTSTTVDLI